MIEYARKGNNVYVRFSGDEPDGEMKVGQFIHEVDDDFEL